jgi:hypothetical protein
VRRFTSYGPINNKLHFYAPRKELINKAYKNLIGDEPSEGGHYFTVWSPRQCGKTWTMQQILLQLKKDPQFDVLKINLENLKDKKSAAEIINVIARKIGEGLDKTFDNINNQDSFQEIFKKDVLEKPLILILDEFDALLEEGINTIVSAFRNIYLSRMDEADIPTGGKSYLLHSVALIGVRSVLGIGQAKGSPFNVQRNLHVPNLNKEEVKGMFQWYEEDSGQRIEPEVVEQLYRETNGQPGLIGWFGELLTEGFEGCKIDPVKPINLRDFEIASAAATYALPNNNILNIISKAKEEKNRTMILELFRTSEKLEFRFDNKIVNSLYLNGIVDKEVVDYTHYYLKFSSPFIQKRLFNYFSDELFQYMGKFFEPFDGADDWTLETHLDIPEIIRQYELYFKNNRDWLLKDAPKRVDLRIFEAVYHFNLYSYLKQLLKSEGGSVLPEFPTGNGKIDLILSYSGKRYGIELKSFTSRGRYLKALEQAARYGKQLNLKEIFLVFFIESINEENRKKYEKIHQDEASKVRVVPLFVETGT